MISHTFIIELMVVLVLLMVVLFCWVFGRKERLASDRGWSIILYGSVLLLFGSVVSLAEHIPSLDRTTIVAQTPYLALFAKIIGFLGGSILVAVGLFRWLPSVATRRRAMGELEQQNVRLQNKAETNSSELELKMIALELEKEQRQRSEAILATVVASTPIVLLATNLDGYISLAQGNSAKVATGLEQNQLVERNIFDVLPSLESDLCRALAGDTVAADVQTHNRVIRYRLGPRRDATEKVTGIICVGHDITDLDEKEQQLRIAKAAAEKANAAKSRFVANISHEIRTPLAGILGLSELLMLEDALPTSARECAERISSSADGLASLVGDVLDFSKIEAEMLLLEEKDFHPIEVLNKLQAIVAHQAAAKGVRFRLEISDDLPLLKGDSTRFLQVLVNLVGNSIKFTSEGHVITRLEEIPENDECKIRLRCTVADTGSGIPPEIQANLFEPFTQVGSRGSQNSSGTGLGLAISKSLVELMGGTISFESSPGKGSTFTFTASFSPSGERRASDDPANAKEEHNLNGSRILVVEDDTVNRVVVSHMLEALGCTPVGVKDGNEALAMLEEESFDLILMDCHMPGLDGYETTHRLRLREVDKKRLPVIALTANAMVGQREACLAAGMDDFIAKPVRRSELYEVLGRWISAP